MGIGVSLILIAAGAILAWAITDTAAGLDVAAIGYILMVVGFIGLAMTLAFWSSFSPFASSAPFRRTAYQGGAAHHDTDVVVERPRQQRTVVVRDEPTTVIRDERPRERTVVIEDPDQR